MAVPDFEDIRPWRIPFYLGPDGKHEFGVPGDEHYEIPERTWFKRQYPDTPEGAMQGFVSFHPEFKKAGWPVDLQTGYEMDIPEETKQKVLQGAQSIWDHYRPEVEAHYGSWNFARTGATVQELASKAYSDIMGDEYARSHMPPRADIQKMKDIHDAWQAAYPNWTQLKLDTDKMSPEEKHKILDDQSAAAEAWDSSMTLDAFEKWLLQRYRGFYSMALNNNEFHPEREQLQKDQHAFDKTVADVWHKLQVNTDDKMQELINSHGANSEEGLKKTLGGALKKFEQQNTPILYSSLKARMEDMVREGPYESYKFYPLAVKWMKDTYKDWLYNGNNQQIFNRFENQSRMAPWETSLPGLLRHVVDVAGEGGRIVDELRRANKLPQNMDVNKMDMGEFESWLASWKRENRSMEAEGEVVYQFHDGWTVQKLTSPESLEYEGDIMGHCVGSYDNEVESGKTIIYSLRDPKGTPHVTMEVEAIEAHKKMFDKPMSDLNEDEARELGMNMRRVEAWPTDEEGGPEYAFTAEYKHPEHEFDDDHYVQSKGHYKLMKPGDKTFEIVQIMGKQNMTPKPEYQRKIREFLDAMREKGMKFQRSDQWFSAFDDGDDGRDPRHDPDVLYGNTTARHLDNWFADYQSNPEHYQNGYEDQYGMQAGRLSANFNWAETLTECCASLIDDYDRDRWKTSNWEYLAKAAYHGFNQDSDTTRYSRPTLEQKKQDALSDIAKAEDKVMEWCDQNSMYMHETNEFADEVEKKYEEMGGKFKDEEYQYNNPSNYHDQYGNPYRDPEDPDLMDEARSELENENNEAYAGNAFKFLNYLYNLFEHEGAVNPEDLPDPNHRDDLPTFDQLQKKNEHIWNQQKIDQQGTTEQGLPGAMSSWYEALAG